MSDHDLYVAAAYLASFIGIAGLVLWILTDLRSRRREIERLESAGIRRRSETRSDRP